MRRSRKTFANSASIYSNAIHSKLSGAVLFHKISFHAKYNSGDAMSFPLQRNLFWIAIILLFGLSNSRVLFAQTGVGALHGQVLDPSGGAVTGASVVFTTPAGDTLAETTNQQGIFDRKGLAPGKYAVQVIAKGFAIYQNDDVEIAAEQIQR